MSTLQWLLMVAIWTYAFFAVMQYLDGGRQLKGVATDLRSTSSPASDAGVLAKPQFDPPDVTCSGEEHTDYWGDAVVWGPDNKKASMKECCESCRRHEHDKPHGCNVWVFCGDPMLCAKHYGDCWLKYLPDAETVNPRTGPDVGWSAGLHTPPETVSIVKTLPDDDRSFHYVISAQGPSVHWQSRVSYYWFKKMKAACQAQFTESGCHMGGFTRLLHSGHADELMEEIPTFVVAPIPKTQQDNKGYVVLNRPYAFVQWAAQAAIPERFVLMAEPDHLILQPLQNPMEGDLPASFPFFYIEPSKPEYSKIVQKFTGPLSEEEIKAMAPVGSSPTFLTMTDLQKVAQVWMDTSLAIFNDEEAHAAWGWVLEMWGWTIACQKTGVGPIAVSKHLLAQPPFDRCPMTGRCPYSLLHYTYGMDYNLKGEFTQGKIGQWRFDKRKYGNAPPPRGLELPPQGLRNKLVWRLIEMINEATDSLPDWDKYGASFDPRIH